MTISYDEKAFIINGRRVWVASGAIHYFRVPRELWRDRLLKLKRAGLNTVETYVAWNAHEQVEGAFDFTDNLDLDAFITLAEEMGLWVIVRPGPYICSEWDNGGIPAWLNAKPGAKLRVANSVYHQYTKLWFEKLIPLVAAHQVTRGGRVILVQDENEFMFRNRPGGRDHLVFVRNLLRRLGIDVPIVVCNFLHERIADTIECWNCWDNAGNAIESLRKAQADAPKLITEFWCGWFEAWGHKREFTRSARDVHANTLEVLAHGGMYNYYMFHGGTNFGFFPGRTDGDDHLYIESSYDFGAPLAETGALGEKYYYTKLAGVFASNMASFLASSEPAALDVKSDDDVEIITRRGDEGHVIFVFNRSRRKKSARITLPSGVSLDVSFADVDAVALPYRFSPTAGFTIDYSNLSLLGMMPMGVGRLVFLYAPRGKKAVLSAQGDEFERKVSDATQLWFGHFPNLVAIMDTERAKSTWFLEDRTVVGAAFAGDTSGEKTDIHSRAAGRVVTYFPNGRVAYATTADAGRPAKLPKLSKWEKRPLLAPGKPSGAVRVDDEAGGFNALESIGYFGGYGWYFTKIKSEKSAEDTLFFTDAEDRLTVFANGRKAGVFGRGAKASMRPVGVRLNKGANEIAVLLDNLGRANYTEALGETKGIRGPVYMGARKLRAKCSWTPPRYNGKLADTWQIDTFWPQSKGVVATLSAVFDRGDGEGVTLRVENVREPAAVFVNRRFHSYFWGARQLSKLDMTFASDELAPGRNLIELAFFVKPEKSVSRAVSLFAFDESRIVRGPWYFAPIEAPKVRARRGARAAAGEPLAWETTFRLKSPPAPVYLVTAGLTKGEIWLNGRMVSRHWDIGPQKKAYLPEPYLTGNNRLVIVDENGASPAKVRLEYDARGIMSRETI